MDFTGKVVLVTGASSGIGAVTAKMFASHGATLSIIGRDEKRLIEVASACEKAKGIKPLWLIIDLTKANSCDIVARKTVEVFGRIDVVVNCAGKAGLTSIFDSNMDVFDDLYATKLRLPYELTQKCLPYLIKTKGHIVLVYGGCHRSRPGLTTMNILSEALKTFTELSAVELARMGVKMVAVQPGHTRTNILKNLNVDDDEVDDLYEILAQATAARKIIEPDEIARMIMIAASDMFPNLNATTLVLNGGGIIA